MSIEELKKDEEFLTKLEAALENKNAAQVKTVLQEKGITLSDEKIAEMLTDSEAELSEDELEDVAGGSWVKHWRAIFKLIGTALSC